ncbi:MAG TPA: endonuclease/exonuclease/phosphatase family protein [Longimicrobium sp.]|jgi:endonuclease/exonuclease/phosphatase family metal-dependent hydrolase
MPRAVICLPIVLLSAGAASTAPARMAQTDAVIMEWNIAGLDPIPPGRLSRIVGVIRDLDPAPDVIVLSEVNPDEAAHQIAQQLGYEAVILQQGPEVVQNIAILHNSRATVSNGQLIAGTNLEEEPRSRQALTANVRIGSFDFILIGVHLKSGRSAAQRAQRTRQATALANFIAGAVQGQEKDVLVIGDYNMIAPTPTRRNDRANFEAMSPAGFLRFVSSEELDGHLTHISGCDPERGNPLDGYAISSGFTTEYQEGSFRLLGLEDLGLSCSEYVVEVSDHLPLLARFRTTADDD